MYFFAIYRILLGIFGRGEAILAEFRGKLAIVLYVVVTNNILSSILCWIYQTKSPNKPALVTSNELLKLPYLVSGRSVNIYPSTEHLPPD